MHCKNVEFKTINPHAKLSKKHKKRTGSDLIRYHVLDIDPLRKLFEKYKTGAETNLRRALHLCRGHFKTFTEDAPLFGRHSGTFWWTQQVRGVKESGTILKDYRVSAPSEIGRAYREVDENPSRTEIMTVPSNNPDAIGRGLAAHNKTQNKIASIISELGWKALSPKSNEPEYDLAWKVKDRLYVCEVKSITPGNEERQLRMGIGQVIRYRQKLNAAGHEPVMAVIAIERVPNDTSWIELCEQENISLVWPENAKEKLSKTIEIDDKL